MTGRPPAARDPARQPERTGLAWRRTMLAFTLVVLLAARLAAREPDGPRLAAVALALAAWVGLLWVTRRRAAEMDAPRPGAPGAVVALTALAVVAYAVLGLLLVWDG